MKHYKRLLYRLLLMSGLALAPVSWSQYQPPPEYPSTDSSVIPEPPAIDCEAMSKSEGYNVCATDIANAPPIIPTQPESMNFGKVAMDRMPATPYGYYAIRLNWEAMSQHVNWGQLTRLLINSLKTQQQTIAFLGRNNTEILVTTIPQNVAPFKRAYYQVRLLRRTCSFVRVKSGMTDVPDTADTCELVIAASKIWLDDQLRRVIPSNQKDTVTQTLESQLYQYLQQTL